MSKGGFELISNVMKLKLIALAAKHGIQVEHFTPGEIIVSIETWREYYDNLLQLIDDLNLDPNIQSITFDPSIGYVYIYYDHSALQHKETINNWIRIFEKYSF